MTGSSSSSKLTTIAPPRGAIDFSAATEGTGISMGMTGTLAQDPTQQIVVHEDTPALPVIPGFEIERELGRGAMGVVFKARQTGLNRDVAIKMVLHGQYACREAVRRFRSEAEAIARFQHGNVVQVYAIGESSGLPYFVLEFVPGGSLQELLAQTQLSVTQALQLAAELAEGVAAAHAAGIVHRDLKPANILLARNEASGTLHPKVADFGIAKDLSSDGATATGAVVGTPAYMSPEQAAGRVHEIGPPSDVYALGAILYEMLTGRKPFEGASLLSTLDLVRHTPPRSVRSLRQDVPKFVEAVCLKCLEKDINDRYSSAEELALDLRRLLAGQRPMAAGGTSSSVRKRSYLAAGVVMIMGFATIAIDLARQHTSPAIVVTQEKPSSPVQVLLVSVHEYKTPQLTTNWQYAERDAQALRRVLTESWGVPESQILTLSQRQEEEDPSLAPTLANIRHHLRGLRERCGPDSRVIVFLTGSGVQLGGPLLGRLPPPGPPGPGHPPRPMGHFHFIPSDGSPDRPETMLSEGELASTLAEVPAQSILVMIDACRTLAPLPMGSPRMLPPRIAPNTSFYFATRPGGQSHEDRVLRHGVFARSVLNALEDGADANKNSLLELMELKQFVEEDMELAVDRLRLPPQKAELIGFLPMSEPILKRPAHSTLWVD